MVFENLTLFEIQLDGAQFGPRSIGGSDDHDEIDEELAETSEEGGRGRFLPVLLLAVLTIGAGMLYRRSRSSEFEFDAESEDAESDLATAQ